MPSLVRSFVELTAYLFTLPGVKLFLSERLCQDPLESFFGKQRQCGGGCDNPTVSAFLSNTSSLRAQGSVSLNPLRGNVQRKRKEFNEREIIEASKPLPKRKKIHQTNE